MKKGENKMIKRVSSMTKCLISVLFVAFVLVLFPLIVKAENMVKIDSSHFPDGAFRTYIIQFDIDTDGYLSKEEIDKIRCIEINTKIYDLSGIEFFPELGSIILWNGKLTT